MSDFPAEHPDGPDAALEAAIELMLREHWYDPELRLALVHDFGGACRLPHELTRLTLPQAVDLMLRALWRDASDLRPLLDAGDFIAAAERLRRSQGVLDEILIASRADVADCIRATMTQLRRRGLLLPPKP